MLAAIEELKSLVEAASNAPKVKPGRLRKPKRAP